MVVYRGQAKILNVNLCMVPQKISKNKQKIHRVRTI